MKTRFKHLANASPDLREQLNVANSLLDALLNNYFIDHQEESNYIAKYDAIPDDAIEDIKKLSIAIGAEFSLSMNSVLHKRYSFLEKNKNATKMELSVIRYLANKKFSMDQIFNTNSHTKPAKHNFSRTTLYNIREIKIHLENLLRELANELELEPPEKFRSSISSASNYSHLRKSNYTEITNSADDFQRKLKTFEEFFLAEYYLTSPTDVQKSKIDELKTIEPQSNELDFNLFVCYIHSEELRNHYRNIYHFQLSLNDIAKSAINFKYESVYKLIFDNYSKLAESNNDAFNMLRNFYNKLPRPREPVQNHAGTVFDLNIANDCRAQFDALKLIKIRQIKKYIEDKLAAGGAEPWKLGWLGSCFGSMYRIPYQGKEVNVPKGMYEIYQWVKDDTLNKRASGSTESKDVLTQIEKILSTKGSSNCFANAIYTLFGCARSNETQASYDEIAQSIGCKV